MAAGMGLLLCVLGIVACKHVVPGSAIGRALCHAQFRNKGHTTGHTPACAGLTAGQTAVTDYHWPFYVL